MRPPIEIVIFVLGLMAVSFLSFLISPFVAWRKGYVPYYWLFAGGPIGLVVVLLFRSATIAETPEEQERMQSEANVIGGTLTVFTLLALMTPFVVVLLMLLG